jgi:hypothetical protein
MERFEDDTRNEVANSTQTPQSVCLGSLCCDHYIDSLAKLLQYSRILLYNVVKRRSLILEE